MSSEWGTVKSFYTWYLLLVAAVQLGEVLLLLLYEHVNLCDTPRHMRRLQLTPETTVKPVIVHSPTPTLASSFSFTVDNGKKKLTAASGSEEEVRAFSAYICLSVHVLLPVCLSLPQCMYFMFCSQLLTGARVGCGYSSQSESTRSE